MEKVFFITEEDHDIFHSGVKGMKWGIRKQKEVSQQSQSKKIKYITEKMKELEHQESVKKSVNSISKNANTLYNKMKSGKIKQKTLKNMLNRYLKYDTKLSELQKKVDNQLYTEKSNRNNRNAVSKVQLKEGTNNNSDQFSRIRKNSKVARHIR